MPALIKTEHVGKIVWLGRVVNREDALRSTSLTAVEARFSGLEGEAHGGLTRPSCSRVVTQYPKGTEIRNVRQLSVVSQEELEKIAEASDLGSFDPAWIGASMVIDGIPDFTHIPPSSRLQAGSGATLTVDMENQPCHLPAKVIDEDAPGHGAAFKAAAKDRRGVTAWVEREGILKVGDAITLHVPAQRAWAP